MEILIVYASRYGQTEKIASRVADVAEEEGARVRLLEVSAVPRGIVFAMFDTVILAGGIAWGRHPRKLRRFIRRNRDALSQARTVLLSVSGTAEFDSGRELAVAYVEKLYVESGWRAGSFVLFGGGVAFTRYGLFTRWVMRRQQRKNNRPTDTTRDYDYTQWDAVDAFARSLVAQAAAHGAA